MDMQTFSLFCLPKPGLNHQSIDLLKSASEIRREVEQAPMHLIFRFLAASEARSIIATMQQYIASCRIDPSIIHNKQLDSIREVLSTIIDLMPVIEYDDRCSFVELQVEGKPSGFMVTHLDQKEKFFIYDMVTAPWNVVAGKTVFLPDKTQFIPSRPTKGIGKLLINYASKMATEQSDGAIYLMSINE